MKLLSQVKEKDTTGRLVLSPYGRIVENGCDNCKYLGNSELAPGFDLFCCDNNDGHSVLLIVRKESEQDVDGMEVTCATVNVQKGEEQDGQLAEVKEMKDFHECDKKELEPIKEIWPALVDAWVAAARQGGHIQ